LKIQTTALGTGNLNLNIARCLFSGKQNFNGVETCKNISLKDSGNKDVHIHTAIKEEKKELINSNKG
jgi:hypothetical protein